MLYREKKKVLRVVVGAGLGISPVAEVGLTLLGVFHSEDVCR